MLRSPRFRKTLRRLLTWAKTAPWRSGADADESASRFARRVLRRLQKNLRESAEGIDWSDAAQRHRLRVKAKRLRYGCNCFAAAFREHEVRPYLKRLRRLQRVLGGMNDIAVQRELLQKLALNVRLGESAAALRATLAARERELSGDVKRSWRALEARKPFWSRQQPIALKHAWGGLDDPGS